MTCCWAKVCSFDEGLIGAEGDVLCGAWYGEAWPGPLHMSPTRPVLIRRRVVAATASHLFSDRVASGRHGAGFYGLMFWFRWNRLSESYLRLICTSRS